MTFDSHIHHRQSVRWRGFDYTSEGAYFVTICVQNRQSIFGEIQNGIMILNDVGAMIQDTWFQMPDRYSGIALDAFVVMPNHIHGIVVLNPPEVGVTPRGCPVAAGQARGPAPTSLSKVIHRYKSLTTARYRCAVDEQRWPPFEHRLWQRNYFDHVIRDEDDLNRIRDYIVENPKNWATDEEYR